MNLEAMTPPQAQELEQSILGALIMDPNRLEDVIGILQPSMFYRAQNKMIYDAIITLSVNNKEIDYFTIKEVLDKRGQLDLVGGIVYIAGLTQNVTHIAHVAQHALIISQYATQRNLITICTKVVEKCYLKEDVFELYDNLLTELEGAFNFTDSNFPRLAGEVLSQLLKDRKENKGGGLMSSFANFDELTNGLKPSDLMILAARPAMGKTAFVLQFASQVVETGKQTLFFSLEMSAEQLIRRVESQLSGLNNKAIELGKIFQGDDEKLAITHKRITKMGLHIDDTAGISVQKMKLKAKRVKSKYGLDLIVVDYLQLASGNGKGNREQEISEISRGLKIIAKELGVPVIALSQLSRAVESRSDKRPLLSDLRESGSIEQDADIVAFLYRDKYYNEMVENDITELIVRKHRNGDLKTLNFLFEGKTTSFKETNEVSNGSKSLDITPFEPKLMSRGTWTKVDDLNEGFDSTPF